MLTANEDKPKFPARALPPALTVLVIVLMVAAAERLGEREIIFPEIAAIATGYLLSPRRTWMTNSRRILILIGVCACMGVAIVRFLPLPLYVQVCIAFAAAQVIYVYSGTSFAPLVSAIVLPVILQTRSLVYPLSAIILTFLIVFLRHLLQGFGFREREKFKPIPRPGVQTWIDVILRIVCVSALAFAALYVRWTFVIAPPLLVAFTEFTNRGGRARKKPVSVILLITMCALAGASSRMLLCVRLGMPLTLAAFTASVLMLIIIYIFGLYLPPAGAATILAMLIPEEALLLYPVQILVGVSALMGMALLFFRSRPLLSLMRK
jgi:hypothetical protein